MPLDMPRLDLDAVDLINSYILLGNHKRAELAALWGSEELVERVLSRKEPLNDGMAHAVSVAWNIPWRMLKP